MRSSTTKWVSPKKQLIGGYSDAIRLLQSLQNEHPDKTEIVSLIEQCQTGIFQQKLNNAKEAINRHNYQEGISQLQALQNEYPNKNEISELILQAQNDAQQYQEKLAAGRKNRNRFMLIGVGVMVFLCIVLMIAASISASQENANATETQVAVLDEATRITWTPTDTATSTITPTNTTTSTSTHTPTATPVVGNVSGNNVNVRSGPGQSFEVVATVSSEDELGIVGVDSDWYLVILPDGETGYVSASLLELPDDVEIAQAATITPTFTATATAPPPLQQLPQPLHPQVN